MQDNKLLMYLVALEMGASDINNFCLSDDKIKKHICDNKDFWLSKIEKERPGMLNVINLRNYSTKKLEQFYYTLQGNNYYYIKDKDKDNHFIIRGTPTVAGLINFKMVVPIDSEFFTENRLSKNKDIFLILLGFSGPLRVQFATNTGEEENVKKLSELLKSYNIDSFTSTYFKSLIDNDYVNVTLNNNILKYVEVYSLKVPKENIFV